MDRRSTLLALGGALPALLVSRGAFAQQASPTPITPGDYALSTLQYGTLSKTISQIAVSRSTNAYVREFAEGEIIEQTAFAQALTSMYTPAPPQLTPEQIEDLEKVRNAPQGAFDATYLGTEISGHKSLFVIQQSLIDEFTMPTSDYVHIALAARAFIENHLFILGRLAAGNA